MKEKIKRPGNGFAFAIVQAVLYTTAALAFLISCLTFVILTPHSFTSYLVNQYGKGERDFDYWYSYRVYEKIEDSGVLDEYYENYENLDFECYLIIDDEPYIQVFIEGYVDNDGDGYYEDSISNNIIFSFFNDNKDERILSFKHSESGKIINVDYYDISSSYVYEQRDCTFLAGLFGGLGGAMVIFAVLQFIVAFRGKKSVRANDCGIALNFIFALGSFGLCGLIGAIKGRMYLQFQALGYSVDKKPVQAEPELMTADIEIESETDVEQIAETHTELNNLIKAEKLEYIQPKMSVKGKKAIMITLIVSYALLFLAGILLAAVPSLSTIISGMGICKEISARAYAITIGVMWITLTPTIGYYFVTISPYELSKKSRMIIFAVCTALLVAMNAVFFIVVNSVKIDELVKVTEFYEGSDSWFVPVSMIFASIAFIVCYLLTLFKINPSKIKNTKPEMPEGHNLFDMIKYIFKMIIYGILCMIKFILGFKEKQPDIFILVSTLLLSWLIFFTAFIFAIICIAILIGVIIMYFAGVINWAYTPTTNNNKQIEIKDGGTNKTLTHNPYLVGSDRYEEVYEEDNGTLWYSQDGGKTVYKK